MNKGSDQLRRLFWLAHDLRRSRCCSRKLCQLALLLFGFVFLAQPLRAQDPSGLLEYIYFSLTRDSVQVGSASQVVVTRDGQIIRVAEAGLHFFDSDVEEATVYDVAVDREHRFETPFQVNGCAADVSIIYQIDEVERFHLTGAHYGRFGDFEAEIGTVLGQVSPDSETPGSDAAKLSFDLLNTLDLWGLRVVRVTVDLGGCGPQPPRIELRERQLPQLETVGAPAALRAELFDMMLITGDSQRVTLRNAVATYDISDAGQLQNCMGSTDERPMVTTSAAQALRVVAGYLSLSDVAELPHDVAEELSRDCGIAFGAIDFSQSSLVHEIPINCDRTPDEPECN